MSAVIVPKGNPPRVLRKHDICEPRHDPRLCSGELVQLAMDGYFPTDQRLEHLLDRIERMQ